MSSLKSTLCLSAIGVLGTGCVAHIAPYKPRHREAPYVAEDYDKPDAYTHGSLYSSSLHGLLENDRASRKGDIVIVNIEENEQGSHDGSTVLGKASKMAVDSSGVADLLKKIVPALDLKSLFGLGSSSDFQGSGAIKKNGSLTANLPLRVRAVLPNADLYLEGSKVIKVGDEEHHLYASGVVRPEDIALDGTVSSTRIADAEFEFVGRGAVDDHQRAGWFTRILQKVSPF